MKRRNVTDWPDTNPSTPLDSYKIHKKTLTPPLASIPNMVTTSWMNDRLPEMLWAILIRKYHTGSIGYAIFRDTMGWLGENLGKQKISGVTHTDIANFDSKLRKLFISRIVEQAGTDAIRPLLLLPNLPAYEDWKTALDSVKPNPEEDWNQMSYAIGDVMFHQTQEATDVRWVKLIGSFLSKKIHFPESMMDIIDGINYYPNKGDQRRVRPSIRSMEMMESLDGDNYKWAELFWNYVYKETICVPEISLMEPAEIASRYNTVLIDKKYYDVRLFEIRQALTDHYMETIKTTAIDARHDGVFMLTLYALDTLIENIILLTSSSTNGRITIRIIFESYITLKFLLKQEVKDESIWDTYRNYGIGQISLIERKYEDNNYKTDLVDIEMMDRIANEDKWSEYVPIQLGNWNVSDLRKISISVGEKTLYDKIYPYTSGYMHANWGAIRESTMQPCVNPLHRWHRIPSTKLPTLTNTNEECRVIINKMLKLVDIAYPTFKNRVRKRPNSGTKRK